MGILTMSPALQEVVLDVIKLKFLKQYVETALWNSTDDDGEPLDKSFTYKDLDISALEIMTENCVKFLERIKLDLNIEVDWFNAKEYAYNFWLTSQHNGSGFWDGDFPEYGEQLTKISHEFKELYLYVGDDNKIYIG